MIWFLLLPVATVLVYVGCLLFLYGFEFFDSVTVLRIVFGAFTNWEVYVRALFSYGWGLVLLLPGSIILGIAIGNSVRPGIVEDRVAKAVKEFEEKKNEAVNHARYWEKEKNRALEERDAAFSRENQAFDRMREALDAKERAIRYAEEIAREYTKIKTENGRLKRVISQKVAMATRLKFQKKKLEYVVDVLKADVAYRNEEAAWSMLVEDAENDAKEWLRMELSKQRAEESKRKEEHYKLPILPRDL